jgi:SAM-dependent methyltransferase
VTSDFLRTRDDVLTLLDDLLDGQGDSRWDALFADRETPRPFLVGHPDENLAEWIEDGQLTPGRALELGPGNGRNAVYLAERGWRVDAVDYSAQAVALTTRGAAAAGVTVGVQHCSIFDLTYEPGSYDLVYDSGCLHHIAPHRRPDYAELVRSALRPGGAFGLVCFRPEGGSGRTDREVYEHRSLGGGLGYAEEHLRLLLADGFAVAVLRRMRSGVAERFGEDFLWALLATRGAGGS